MLGSVDDMLMLMISCVCRTEQNNILARDDRTDKKANAYNTHTHEHKCTVLLLSTVHFNELITRLNIPTNNIIDVVTMCSVGNSTGSRCQ